MVDPSAATQPAQGTADIDESTEPKFELDGGAMKGFVPTFREHYNSTPSQVIRIFNRKDFYTVHGHCAEFVALEHYKTRSVIKYACGNAESGLAGVCLSHQMFESVLRDTLLNRGLKVELMTTSSDSATGWAVEKKASPGNLQAFDSVLFRHNESQDTPVLAALQFKGTSGQPEIGFAFIDTTRRVIGVHEYVDDTAFTSTESVLVQLGVKECVLPVDPTGNYKKVRTVLEKCGVALTERKTGHFKAKDIEQDLKRLLGGITQNLAELDLSLAMGASACVLKELELLADASNFGRYKMKRFDLRQFMRLDQAAVQALNLFPQANEGNTSMSLYGLLNKCKTSIGSRMLLRWVKQPLLDEDAINKRLNMVELFVQSPVIMSGLQDLHLKRIPDLHRLASKLEHGKAGLQDCVTVYQCVRRLPFIKDHLDEYQGQYRDQVSKELIQPLQRCMSDFENLEAMIEATIDLASVDNHEYLIKAEFDEELQHLAASKDEVLDEINAVTEEVGDSLGADAKKLKVERNDVRGYYMRLSRKDEKLIRNKPRFVVLETRKDGVRFTTSKLRTLSKQYSELSKQYDTKQGELVDRAIDIVASYVPVMEEAAELIALVDVCIALAHVSVTAPVQYVRPTIKNDSESGSIKLKAARHPCMEVQDSVSFIANDVDLVRNKNAFDIITGPNMGGKSTYIRQVGLVTVMAHIGCFVPCEEAEVCITDRILCRIGAGDSQIRGVSTFMAEMLETANILKAATPQSLIIIDELGRGTSTYDGFGIAWAISEHIAKDLKSLCLFATHFHELTGLASQVPTVTNRHVTAQTADGELVLLYTVKPGPCDQSFGIHVAKMAQFPTEVVAVAKRKADELEDFGAVQVAGDSKRQKVDEVEDVADDLITDFLSKIAAMPLDTLSEEEAVAFAEKACKELLSSENSVVTQLAQSTG